jgi:hypothetical protein
MNGLRNFMLAGRATINLSVGNVSAFSHFARRRRCPKLSM